MNKLSNYKLNIKGESDLNKFKRYIETGDRAKYYPTMIESFGSMMVHLAAGQVITGLVLNNLSKLKLGMKNG